MAARRLKLSQEEEMLFSTIPSLTDPQEGIFKSLDDVQFGLPAVLRILSGSKTVPSFLIQTLEVDISARHTSQHLRQVHERAALVICAPKKKNETKEEIERRERELLRYYSAELEVMKAGGAAQVFRGIDSKTKKLLISKEKALHKKRSKKKADSY